MSEEKTPLSNCVIAFTPSATKAPNHLNILSDLREQGAQSRKTLAAAVTHLVALPADVAANTRTPAILNHANTRGIPLVTSEWLEKAISDAAAFIADPTGEPPALPDVAKFVVVDSTDVSTANSQKVDTKPSGTAAPTADVVSDEDEPDVKKPRKKKQKKETKADKELPVATTSSSADVSPKKMVIAVRKGRVIVDEHCPVSSLAHVYEDATEGPYDALLNQADIAGNNNKFYIISVMESDAGNEYFLWTRWGRVGAIGQSDLKQCGSSKQAAISGFHAKFRDKTKNNWQDRAHFVRHKGKYMLIERDFGDDIPEEAEKTAQSRIEESVPECTLPAPVEMLVKLIFNLRMMEQEMAHVGYDATRMPLGKLTKEQILRGYKVLKCIEDKLQNRNAGVESLQDLSSEFYTVIPHDFGRNRPPTIDTVQKLKDKERMVEDLGKIQVATNLLRKASTVGNPADSHYLSLRCKIEPVSRTSDMFALMQTYMLNTHAATHSGYTLQIDEAFAVLRDPEDSPITTGKHNRQLLWHGSRLTNFAGILSEGLRIAPPEAPVTGHMFSKGVYFADAVSKSANYCFTSPGQNQGLLLLCEVGLGDPHELVQADYNAVDAVRRLKKHSCKGVGAHTPDPKETQTIEDGVVVPMGKLIPSGQRGALMYNEYIVYDIQQVRIRYLMKCTFNYNRSR